MSPSFTSAVPEIFKSGPLVNVKIGIEGSLSEVMLKEGKTLPEQISALAMIDTGSSITAVRLGYSEKLGISPIGSGCVQSPSSSDHSSVYSYRVRIIFPYDIFWEGNVIEPPAMQDEIDCLIGRDILSLGIFIYNGTTNQFTLAL